MRGGVKYILFVLLLLLLIHLAVAYGTMSGLNLWEHFVAVSALPSNVTIVTGYGDTDAETNMINQRTKISASFKKRRIEFIRKSSQYVVKEKESSPLPYPTMRFVTSTYKLSSSATSYPLSISFVAKIRRMPFEPLKSYTIGKTNVTIYDKIYDVITKNYNSNKTVMLYLADNVAKNDTPTLQKLRIRDENQELVEHPLITAIRSENAYIDKYAIYVVPNILHVGAIENIKDSDIVSSPTYNESHRYLGVLRYLDDVKRKLVYVRVSYNGTLPSANNVSIVETVTNQKSIGRYFLYEMIKPYDMFMKNKVKQEKPTTKPNKRK